MERIVWIRGTGRVIASVDLAWIGQAPAFVVILGIAGFGVATPSADIERLHYERILGVGYRSVDLAMGRSEAQPDLWVSVARSHILDEAEGKFFVWKEVL